MSSQLKRHATTAPATQKKGSLYLADLMRSELKVAEDLSRSELTRQKLLIAATDIMQSEGFNGLTVAAICKAAGFAHGTFYLHWADRKAIGQDVISKLMEAIKAARPKSQPGQTLFERLIEGHLFYISIFRQNAGLMNCQWQLADQMDGFAQISLKANMAMARRVLNAVAREKMQMVGNDAERLTTVLSCISMVDKLLHDVFTRGLDLGLTDEELARNISLSWYRAIFGKDPRGI